MNATAGTYEPPTTDIGSEVDFFKSALLAEGVGGYAVTNGSEIWIPSIDGDGTGKVGRFLDSLGSRCVIVNCVSTRLQGMMERRGWVMTMADTEMGPVDTWRKP